MFDLVHHTNTNRLSIVVINVKGPLLSVCVLTQHPLSETGGCCGLISQPKVLTDETFVHQLILFGQTIRHNPLLLGKSKCRNLFYCCVGCAIYLNVQILTTLPDMFICMCIVLHVCMCLTLRRVVAEGGAEWVWRAQCAASVNRKVV